MTAAAEPKEFTKEEIRAFTAEQAERYARNLDWPYGRIDRQNLAAFKREGFPGIYAGAVIASRRDFLIRRLQAAKQETWNPDMKLLAEKRRKEAVEAAAKKRKEEEAREAAKPRVVVTTSVRLLIHLKDARPRGHTFDIERKGEYLRCGQQQNRGTLRGNYKGMAICATKGNYRIDDFIHALELVISIDIPDTMKSTDKASFSFNVTLQGTQIPELRDNGDYALSLERKGDIVMISQAGSRYVVDTDKWHFNITDLQEVITALKKKYKFVVVEDEPESTEPLTSPEMVGGSRDL